MARLSDARWRAHCCAGLPKQWNQESFEVVRSSLTRFSEGLMNVRHYDWRKSVRPCGGE